MKKTIGILGNINYIDYLIKHNLYKKVRIKEEIWFLVEINYDKNLLSKFKRKYTNLYNFLKKSPKHIQKKFECFVEKDKIAWFTKEDLYKNKKKLRKHVLPFLDKL